MGSFGLNNSRLTGSTGFIPASVPKAPAAEQRGKRIEVGAYTSRDTQKPQPEGRGLLEVFGVRDGYYQIAFDLRRCRIARPCSG